MLGPQVLLTFWRGLQKQLVVADQGHDLSIQVEGVLSEHLFECEPAAETGLIADELNGADAGCHVDSPTNARCYRRATRWRGNLRTADALAERSTDAAFGPKAPGTKRPDCAPYPSTSARTRS